jgi:NhaP-type Na+/H+ or K+/H+ antiporter
VFFLFGVVALPILPRVTWSIVFYAVLSLTVVRMIPVAVSLIGTRLSRASMLFVGWFGPPGLASIVLTAFALEEAPALSGRPVVVAVVIVTILLSVYAHGTTAMLFPNFTRKGSGRSPSMRLNVRMWRSRPIVREGYRGTDRVG